MPSWPAVGIHRLSVPSGADAKTHAAQGGEGTLCALELEHFLFADPF